MNKAEEVVNQTPTIEANGSSGGERLTIKRLQDECESLRRALAKAEQERNYYRKALYEQSRASREFVDVDIASLQAISAGPVEMIEG